MSDYELTIIDVSNVFSVLLNYIFIWLFLLTTLINFSKSSSFNYSVTDSIRKETTFLSLTMFLSYFLSINVGDFGVQYVNGFLLSFHFFYFIFDVLTMLILFFLLKVNTERARVCRFYLLFFLGCNAVLFLLMHIEIVLYWEVHGAYSHWWFWDLFTYSINIFDTLMVLSLLTCKDFLGFFMFKRRVNGFLVH